MLIEQTKEKLVAMKLHGMADALNQWLAKPKEKEIAPADLVGILADAEWIHRENNKLTVRLRNARFREPQACVEDVDYSHARGLSKQVMLELATCRWLTAHQNVIITGMTGLGKSWLACALGQKACRDGYTVVYRRVPRLFDELAQARADGTHFQLLRRFAKIQVLILDDFGLEVMTAPQRRDLLEVVEDRYGASSTIVTSQLDPDDWHPIIGDETVADALCDRLVHNAHRIKLSRGESIRKTNSPLTKETKKAK
jgi:DNA replication protein DnaC